MAFPWVAVASGALGLGSSFLGAASKESARKAENKARKESYQAQQGAARASARAQMQQDEINYAWKLAENEALKFQEEQAKADYNFRQGRLTESALKNLEINEQAVFDQYVTSEDLRATQDQLSLTFAQDQLGLEANRAARQYMTTIQDNALQAQQTAMQANRQVETLVRNQVLDGQMDTLERDIQFVAALADRGQQKARSRGRGLTATTAKAKEMTTAKALGRSYGTLMLRQQKRRASLATMNATMQGEVAKGLARFALSSKAAMDNMAASNKDYGMKGQFALDKFEKLTMPGYTLASRQGQRDLDSLFLRTQGQLDEASMPYRESIRFEPQKALAPMYSNITKPTYRQAESTAGVIGGALIAGVNGALKGTYTGKDGALKWF